MWEAAGQRRHAGQAAGRRRCRQEVQAGEGGRGQVGRRGRAGGLPPATTCQGGGGPGRTCVPGGSLSASIFTTGCMATPVAHTHAPKGISDSWRGRGSAQGARGSGVDVCVSVCVCVGGGGGGGGACAMHPPQRARHRAVTRAAPHPGRRTTGATPQAQPSGGAPRSACPPL